MIAAPPLGMDRVERQARLPRPAHPRQHHQSVARDVDVHISQVMDANSPQPDGRTALNLSLDLRCHPIALPPAASFVLKISSLWGAAANRVFAIGQPQPCSKLGRFGKMAGKARITPRCSSVHSHSLILEIGIMGNVSCHRHSGKYL